LCAWSHDTVVGHECTSQGTALLLMPSHADLHSKMPKFHLQLNCTLLKQPCICSHSGWPNLNLNIWPPVVHHIHLMLFLKPQACCLWNGNSQLLAEALYAFRPPHQGSAYTCAVTEIAEAQTRTRHGSFPGSTDHCTLGNMYLKSNISRKSQQHEKTLSNISDAQLITGSHHTSLIGSLAPMTKPASHKSACELQANLF